MAPEISQGLHEVEASEGEVVKFQCRFLGKPVPEIEWYKDDELLEESERMKFENNDGEYVLTIRNVSSFDEAEYKVLARNPLGTATCAAELLVEESVSKPELIRPMEDVVINSEEDGCFRVLVKGDVKVDWYKNDKLLEDEGRVVIVDEDDGETFTLAMEEATVEDSGVYKCVASNKAGEVTCSASLKVTSGKPEAPAIKPTVVSPVDKSSAENLQESPEEMTLVVEAPKSTAIGQTLELTIEGELFKVTIPQQEKPAPKQDISQDMPVVSTPLPVSKPKDEKPTDYAKEETLPKRPTDKEKLSHETPPPIQAKPKKHDVASEKRNEEDETGKLPYTTKREDGLPVWARKPKSDTSYKTTKKPDEKPASPKGKFEKARKSTSQPEEQAQRPEEVFEMPAEKPRDLDEGSLLQAERPKKVDKERQKAEQKPGKASETAHRPEKRAGKPDEESARPEEKVRKLETKVARPDIERTKPEEKAVSLPEKRKEPKEKVRVPEEQTSKPKQKDARPDERAPILDNKAQRPQETSRTPEETAEKPRKKEMADKPRKKETAEKPRKKEPRSDEKSAKLEAKTTPKGKETSEVKPGDKVVRPEQSKKKPTEKKPKKPKADEIAEERVVKTEKPEEAQQKQKQEETTPDKKEKLPAWAKREDGAPEWAKKSRTKEAPPAIKPKTTRKPSDTKKAPEFFEDLLEPVVEVVEGEDLNLTLKMKGRGKFAVDWFKNDVKITERPRCTTKTDGDTCELIVKNVTPEDEGTYRCVVTNDAGGSSRTFEINIKGIV